MRRNFFAFSLFVILFQSTFLTYAPITAYALPNYEEDNIKPADFLVNPDFSSGLEGWQINLLENLGTNIISWSSKYEGSAEIYVSGAPAAGDIEQRITRPLRAGEKILIRVYQTYTGNFGGWAVLLYNGTFAGVNPSTLHTPNKYSASVTGAKYTPLDGVMIKIADTGRNNSAGLKECIWTVDRDYPAGTWLILHGSVWPGKAKFWFLGIYIIEEKGENVLGQFSDKQLTVGKGHDLYPVWSPDGSKILFTRLLPSTDNDKASLSIWITDMKGTLSGPIFYGEIDWELAGVYQRKGWSPDGSKIAFLILKRENGLHFDELYIFDLSRMSKRLISRGEVVTLKIREQYFVFGPNFVWLSNNEILLLRINQSESNRNLISSSIHLMDDEGRLLKTLIMEHTLRKTFIYSLFASNDRNIIGYVDIYFEYWPDTSVWTSRVWLFDEDGNKRLLAKFPNCIIGVGGFSLDDSKMLIETWSFEKDIHFNLNIGVRLIDISTGKIAPLFNSPIISVRGGEFINIGSQEFKDKIIYRDLIYTTKFDNYEIWSYNIKDLTKIRLLSKNFEAKQSELLEKDLLITTIFLLYESFAVSCDGKIAYTYPDNEGRYLKIWMYYQKEIGKENINVMVDVPSEVPFNRFFSINVTLCNLESKSASLTISLEERVGFQAGFKYGDGDELKYVSLAPNEKRTITFKAKVYGIPRAGDMVHFNIYDKEGKLVYRGSHKIYLKPDFAEVTSVLAPVAVRKGESFTIGLPVFYSFSYDTSVEIVLLSKESGKTLQIRDMLNGDGLKIYSFIINNSLVDLDSEGIRKFGVKMNVYYPEEGYKRAYEEEFDVAVRVSTDAGTASVIPLWSFTIFLTYNGKEYVSVYAYNATRTPPPETGDFEDMIVWFSSQRNWLIFKVDGEDVKPVMNDDLHKKLAFASEIAYLRATRWDSKYLASRSILFDKVSNLARYAESCNFIAKLAGKLAGIIGLKAAGVWASSVLSGVEFGSKISDASLTIARTVEILRKLDLHGKILSALNAGAKGEEILVWTAIFMLDGGKASLDEANELLKGISISSRIMNVDVDEALRFYRLVQLGESLGLGGIYFLSTHYSKEDTINIMSFELSVKPFKDALLAAVPLAGDAYEFYEKLREGLGIPSAFKFGRYISTVWSEYDIRQKALEEASLKFRDKYISESMNSITITLYEPKTQRKLHLSVYDDKGRLVGFNKTSNVVEVKIPCCYYLDFGNIIKITLPRETKIDKIIVDATEAETSVENYTLTVKAYRNGNMVGSTSKTDQIKKESLREYSLQITEDSNLILEEVQAPNYLYYFVVGMIALAAMITAIALRRTKVRPSVMERKRKNVTA